jgi:hypothetical protein
MLDRDAGVTQPSDALAVDPLVGIEHGDHHASHPRIDQRIRAGRGLAPMAARLQGDIGGGTASSLPGLG